IDRTIVFRQIDYAGVQLWASNPAVIWTAPQDEEEGIHVHTYDGEDRIIDDTYSAVTIDNITLNPTHVRYYMAQMVLAHLAGHVTSLECPAWGPSHFDTGVLATQPHREHDCQTCGIRFPAPGRALTIGNPFVRQRRALEQTHAPTAQERGA